MEVLALVTKKIKNKNNKMESTAYKNSRFGSFNRQ
jgi:hypothetical protein